MTNFKLGKHSLAELKGVHPDLVAVVNYAIELTEIDFSVHDGLRSREEQMEYFRTGASQLKFGKHKRQGREQGQQQPRGGGHHKGLAHIHGDLARRTG